MVAGANYFYVLEAKSETWENANKTCTLKNGTLASPVSFEDDEALRINMFNDGMVDIWLGAMRIDGDWKWITGN